MNALWLGSVMALAVGGGGVLGGAVRGLLRLPDFYTRAHAVSKCDTVGAGSVLLALALFVAPHPDALKILILLALIRLSSPTSCHALAHAAHHTGLEPRATATEGEP